VEITKQQVLDLWNALTAIAADNFKTKLSYAMARNRDRIKPIIQAVEEASKPIEGFREARLKLMEEMCARKPDGEPIVLPNGDYAINERGKFEIELDKIKKKTGQDKKDEELAALLKEKEDVRLYMVDFEALPENIRPDVMGAMLVMVKEPADEEAEAPPPAAEPAPEPAPEPAS
jgi:hypothetical protein